MVKCSSCGLVGHNKRSCNSITLPLTDRAEFEKEKAAFEKEKAAFEKEKAAFEKEKAAFEKEKAAFEKKNSKVKIERSSAPQQKKNMENTLDWNSIILENNYINEKKSSAKDPHSFTSLAKIHLTQSQNITLGICVEHAIRDCISKNAKGWVSIKEANKKGEKEKDHLYKNDTLKVIIYGEQKNNINLDTEKSVNTKDKVHKIHRELQEKYPDYTIISMILATRYLSAKDDLAKSIINQKYKNIMVVGINDFLDQFALPKFESYDTYKDMIETIINTKFSSCE